MNDNDLKSAVGQRYLFLKGYYHAPIDGDWGVLSLAAAEAWANAEAASIAARVAAHDRQVIISRNASLGFLRTLAAQIHLADLKLYEGPIDGNWGPQSKHAARLWQAIYLPVEKVPDDEQPGLLLTPYEVAKRYIGTKEIPGKKHNGVILNFYRRLQISIFDDETAWCSTFVNFCALESGYERTGKLNARSWLDLGEHIRLPDAREGDVVIFERGTTGWEGHVAFFTGVNRNGTRISHLGGNQSDSVNIAESGTSKLLGIRRLRSLDQLQGSSNKI